MKSCFHVKCLILICLELNFIWLHSVKLHTIIPWLRGKQLSRVKERSSGKLLPKTEGRGQQCPRVSPFTEGQLIDCSPGSHGIRFYYLTYYIMSIKNKLNLFATSKSGECCLIKNILITWTLDYHKDAWNRQQFILWLGNSSTVSWYKKSEEKKLGEC